MVVGGRKELAVGRESDEKTSCLWSVRETSRGITDGAASGVVPDWARLGRSLVAEGAHHRP